MKRGRPSTTTGATSTTSTTMTTMNEAETPATVIIDDPYWGSPDACSLTDLLKKMERSKTVLHCSDDYLVLDKSADLRMDGPFEATVHKLLTYWFPPTSVLQLVSNANATATASASTSADDPNKVGDTAIKYDNDVLMNHVKTLHKHNDVSDNELRPCHQLDYATSGVLLVARNAAAADNARVAFEHRLAKKQYLAVLYGHVAVLDSDEESESKWPVLLAEAVEEQIEALEASYRRERGKRRKDTWNGYQPSSSMFMQWKKQHTRKAPPKGSNNHRSKNEMTDENWQEVWNELQLPESELEIMRGWGWKDVKAAKQKAPFERAALVYNRLQCERIERENAPPSVEELPTFFRIQGDNAETFYVFASIAQPDDGFAMCIHPKLANSLPSPSLCNLLVGDTEMDYKPSLTKVTVQNRTKMNGQCVTKVCLEPRTGRRHQLRVHIALLGHPIVGDQTYQPAADAPDISERMCLHAYRLEIPLQGKNYKFEAADPFANDAL
jgi:23S rRNA-/tRNA-specific pseudouridylate synthase